MSFDRRPFCSPQAREPGWSHPPHLPDWDNPPVLKLRVVLIARQFLGGLRARGCFRHCGQIFGIDVIRSRALLRPRSLLLS